MHRRSTGTIKDLSMHGLARYAFDGAIDSETRERRMSRAPGSYGVWTTVGARAIGRACPCLVGTRLHTTRHTSRARRHTTGHTILV